MSGALCHVSVSLRVSLGGCWCFTAQIVLEGRERYQNTLVGRLSDFMREVGEPVTLQQCVDALRDVFSELKKPDGSHSRGSVERAIHGALWSTGVFQKTEVRCQCSARTPACCRFPRVPPVCTVEGE